MTKKENAALANENSASHQANDTTFFLCPDSEYTVYKNILAEEGAAGYARTWAASVV